VKEPTRVTVHFVESLDQVTRAEPGDLVAVVRARPRPLPYTLDPYSVEGWKVIRLDPAPPEDPGQAKA